MKRFLNISFFIILSLFLSCVVNVEAKYFKLSDELLKYEEQSILFEFKNYDKDKKPLPGATYELRNMDNKTMFVFDSSNETHSYSYNTFISDNERALGDLLDRENKAKFDSVKKVEDLSLIKSKFVLAEYEGFKDEDVYLFSALIPFKIVETKAPEGYENEIGIVYLVFDSLYYADGNDIKSYYIEYMGPYFIDFDINFEAEEEFYMTIYKYDKNIDYNKKGNYDKISSCKYGSECDLFMINYKLGSNVDGKIYISELACTNIYNGSVNEHFSTYVHDLNIDTSDTLFYKKGDNLKCTIQVTNDSREDVQVDEQLISKKSDEYIGYKLTSDSDDVIKAGAKKNFYLNIEYLKEYEKDKVVDSNLEIKIIGDVENPGTSEDEYWYFVLGIVIMILVIMIVLKVPKKAIISMCILGGVLFIPMIYALVTATITLNNRIVIKGTDPHVYYHYRTQATKDELSTFTYYEYVSGGHSEIVYDGDKYYMVNVIIDAGQFSEGTKFKIKKFENRYFYNCSSVGSSICCYSMSSSEGRLWEDGKEIDSNIFYEGQEYTMGSKDVHFYEPEEE